MKRSKAIFTIVLLASLTAVRAIADSGINLTSAKQSGPLDCLTRAKGKVLLWDTRWEGTPDDEGVAYRVLEISTRYTYPVQSQSVTLILSSATTAEHPYRKLVASDGEKATAVCSRLRELSAIPPSPAPAPALSAAPEIAPDMTLPFITYSTDGWVRADTPPQAQVTICRVLHRPFLCTKEDRKKFSDRLQEVEAVLLNQENRETEQHR